VATDKKLTIGFWGLLFMVSFLYAKGLTFTLTCTPLSYPQRYDPKPGRGSLQTVGQVLWVLSYPSIQNADRLLPQEPYFFELVYRPFFAAFQWFGYGCLFGWWRYRRKIRKGSG